MMESTFLWIFITCVILNCPYCHCHSMKSVDNIVQMNQDIEAAIFQNDLLKAGDKVTFSFSKYFQNHMVLQQAPKRANIHGFSPDIGQKVIAMLTTVDKKYYYTTKVEQGPSPGVGVWFITLDPILTVFPVSITVASDAGTLTLEDVLFGDVWICSGQSNMQFTLMQMTNAFVEIMNAHKYPDVRFMDVGRKPASTPQYDFISISKNWSLPNIETVPTFSAVCWLYGKALNIVYGYPIGLIGSDFGGTPIATWSSPDALAKCGVSEENIGVQPPSGLHVNPEVKAEHQQRELQSWESQDAMWNPPQQNSVLWNSMIHPFLGLTFYGVIWYQGESDATPERMDIYNCTFPALIEDWRHKFHQASKGQTALDFPFGFVQLGPNAAYPTSSVGFPDIRWHQTADTGFVPNPKMPNVFMAVAMDLADFLSPYGSVHIRDKEDVAFRLVIAGLAVAYNVNETFQGPFPTQAFVNTTGLLEIDYGSEWTLVVKNSFGFEVLCTVSSGNETVWMEIPIVEYTKTRVILALGTCGLKPLALRYAWLVSPCRFKNCAIYESVYALPAPPFIVYATGDGKNDTMFHFK